MKAIKEKLTEEERELAEAARGQSSHDVAEARVVTDLWVAHRMREMADDMISANKKLAKSSGDTATALNDLTKKLVWFTGLLCLVGLVQAYIIWSVS